MDNNLATLMASVSSDGSVSRVVFTGVEHDFSPISDVVLSVSHPTLAVEGESRANLRREHLKGNLVLMLRDTKNARLQGAINLLRKTLSMEAGLTVRVDKVDVRTNEPYRTFTYTNIRRIMLNYNPTFADSSIELSLDFARVEII